MIRNDLLTDVRKERKALDPKGKISDATRTILQSDMGMSLEEADYHVNSLIQSENLYHRNPDMLAAAIRLYVDTDGNMPNREVMVTFIESNRGILEKVGVKWRSQQSMDLYVREMVKYYRYVSLTKERAFLN